MTTEQIDELLNPNTIEVTVCQIGRHRWRGSVRVGWFTEATVYALTKRRCIGKAMRQVREAERRRAWRKNKAVVYRKGLA